WCRRGSDTRISRRRNPFCFRSPIARPRKRWEFGGKITDKSLDATAGESMEQLTAAHGNLTAMRTGAGRDLVVLHSLLTDRQAFDPVLPALSAKFRLTLFTLPGLHGSQRVAPALLDAYVARIEDGFEEFRIENDAVLLGNGFGGTLALAFALAHPERVGKLVISDAAAAFPEQGRQAFRVMAEKVAQ